jgi:hypothetical protein
VVEIATGDQLIPSVGRRCEREPMVGDSLLIVERLEVEAPWRGYHVEPLVICESLRSISMCEVADGGDDDLLAIAEPVQYWVSGSERERLGQVARPSFREVGFRPFRAGVWTLTDWSAFRDASSLLRRRFGLPNGLPRLVIPVQREVVSTSGPTAVAESDEDPPTEDELKLWDESQDDSIHPGEPGYDEAAAQFLARQAAFPPDWYDAIGSGASTATGRLDEPRMPHAFVQRELQDPSNETDEAKAKAIVSALGVLGYLRECPMTWERETQAEGPHRQHACGSFVGHSGRCTCRIPGCRSWTVNSA